VTLFSVVVGHRHLKYWYPTTALHNVTTQRTEDGGSIDLWNVGILPQYYTMSQPRSLKMEAARTSETLVSYYNITRHNPEDWRWRQHGPLKCWYPTTTLHDVTTQKTEDGGSMDLWNFGILYNTTQRHNPEDLNLHPICPFQPQNLVWLFSSFTFQDSVSLWMALSEEDSALILHMSILISFWIALFGS
jgi:hypothetical protein